MDLVKGHIKAAFHLLMEKTLSLRVALRGTMVLAGIGSYLQLVEYVHTMTVSGMAGTRGGLSMTALHVSNDSIWIQFIQFVDLLQHDLLRSGHFLLFEGGDAFLLGPSCFLS